MTKVSHPKRKLNVSEIWQGKMASSKDEHLANTQTMNRILAEGFPVFSKIHSMHIITNKKESVPLFIEVKEFLDKKIHGLRIKPLTKEQEQELHTLCDMHIGIEHNPNGFLVPYKIIGEMEFTPISH